MTHVPDVRTYLFVHIPKTAGTSFRIAVARLFPDRVFHDYGKGSNHTWERVRELVHEKDDLEAFGAALSDSNVAMLGGHVNYSRYAALFPSDKVMTFVRDPVARVVSNYGHSMRNQAFDGTLMEFASSPRNRNLQSRLLKGVDLAELGFLGITERYVDSLRVLRHTVGWEVEPLAMNRNRDKGQKSAPVLSDEDERAVRELNLADHRLYREACRVFDERLRAAGLSSEARAPVVSELPSRPSGERPGRRERGLRARGERKPRKEGKGRRAERGQKAGPRPEPIPVGPYARRPLPLVSTKRELGLLFTPNAGSTAAVTWFFAQTGLLEAALFFAPSVHRFRQQVFYQSEAYAPEHIALPGMRIVKFVRDPFERAVSAFVQASRRGHEDVGLTGFLGRKIDKQHGFSFREFVAYLDTLKLDDCDPHHRIQRHPLEREGLVRPTHLVQIEKSSTMLPALEQELGLLATDPALVSSLRDHARRADTREFCGDVPFVFGKDPGGVPETRWFYDAELRAAVARLYQEDFEAYGYSTTAGASLGG